MSTWSKDPSTKIGAVAIGEDAQVLSQGYNGFPRGIEDTEDRLNNREVKYDYVVHGEENCIFNACLNGVSLKNSVLFVYGLPICSKCTNGALQVGVKQVVMLHPHDIPDKWKEEWQKSKSKLEEAMKSYIRYEHGESGIDSIRIVEGLIRHKGRLRAIRGTEPKWETIEDPYYFRTLR